MTQQQNSATGLQREQPRRPAAHRAVRRCRHRSHKRVIPMLEDIKKDATQRMAKCVISFRNDLKKLRTGRAHPSLIEHLRVDYYGTESPLTQVANITVEDARTLA